MSIRLKEQSMPNPIQKKLQEILNNPEGSKTYKRLSENLKENLGAILDFLLNTGLVHKYIQKFASDYEKINPQNNKKTLRFFFTQWGAENGFNLGDSRENTQSPLRYEHCGKIYKLSKFHLPKEIPYLVGILPSSLFTRVFLGFGYLICDPGSGIAHGKWTHSLQLFMLEEARKNKELKLINCDSIVNLMKEISCHESRGDKIFAPLFDSQTRTDYTRPETLMKAIHDKNLIKSDEMATLRDKLFKHQKKIEQLDGKEKEYEQKFAKNATHYYGFQTEEKTVGFFWGKSKTNSNNLIAPVIEKQSYVEGFQLFTNKFLSN